MECNIVSEEYNDMFVEYVGLNRHQITYSLDNKEKFTKDMKNMSSYGKVTEIFIDNGYGFELKANTNIDWGN